MMKKYVMMSRVASPEENHHYKYLPVTATFPFSSVTILFGEVAVFATATAALTHLLMTASATSIDLSQEGSHCGLTTLPSASVRFNLEKNTIHLYNKIDDAQHHQHHVKPARPVCRRSEVRLLLCALFLAVLGPYVSLKLMNRTHDNTSSIREEIIMSGFNITANSSVGITHDTNEHGGKNINNNTSKLTVLISTYNQTGCLHRLVNHLQKCPVVDNIRINWFQNFPIPQSLANNTNFNTPVTFDTLPNNISHRFLPRDFGTDAVFNMDVDMSYSCDALQLAMDTWQMQTNQTHAAVGFFPRYLPPDKKYYKFDESHYEPYNRNTIFITKGGLIHKDRFNDFFNDSLKPLLDHVDEHITAEDMLMSHILASNQVKTITLCVPRSYWCNLICSGQHESGQYDTLQQRSGGHRGHLMVSFRDYFGNISMEERYNPMIWHGDVAYGSGCNTEFNFCRDHEWMRNT